MSKGQGCSPDASACAGAGYAEFAITPTTVNTNASQNKLTNAGTFYHELSHALRYFVSEPWWGLEEGLAVYTAEHLANEKNTIPATGISKKIYSQIIPTGKTIFFSQEQYYGLLDLTATITKDGALSIAYTGFMEESINGKFLVSNGESQFVSSYLARFDIQDEQHVLLRLYDSAHLDAIQKPSCTPEGTRLVSQIATDDGTADVKYPLVPYKKLGSFVRHGNQGGYYNTGFCFWETLRQQYGHDAVKTMVQSMLEFSKQQPVSMCPGFLSKFPFFNTFKDVTGMTDTQAKEYFARFSVPTDDDWYVLGSVNWPK